MEDLIEVSASSIKGLRDELNKVTDEYKEEYSVAVLWDTYRKVHGIAQSIKDEGRVFIYSVLVIVLD
jgi:hypothetical protein